MSAGSSPLATPRSSTRRRGAACPRRIRLWTSANSGSRSAESTIDGRTDDQFAPVRVITNDLDRPVGFYEQASGVKGERPASMFAELVLPSCTLAIGHAQTVQLFGEGSGRAADNHTVILEFQVDDVDAEHARLKAFVDDWVQEPTTMPWGNRSILFRDPDGNPVNLYSPVTPEAIERFGGRGTVTMPVGRG